MARINPLLSLIHVDGPDAERGLTNPRPSKFPAPFCGIEQKKPVSFSEVLMMNLRNG